MPSTLSEKVKRVSSCKKGLIKRQMLLSRGILTPSQLETRSWEKILGTSTYSKGFWGSKGVKPGCPLLVVRDKMDALQLLPGSMRFNGVRWGGVPSLDFGFKTEPSCTLSRDDFTRGTDQLPYYHNILSCRADRSLVCGMICMAYRSRRTVRDG